MPSIYTLKSDIYSLVRRKDGWFTDELANYFAAEVARRVQSKFNTPERAPTLRLSKMGPVCPCALWYSIHHPELAEPLPPWAEIKYTYGHMLEALATTLVKAAGHEVTGEQDELVVDGIRGHRDCVVDGCIVDVKSASSRVFEKFEKGLVRQDDPFGYLDQLDGYLAGSQSDPLVRTKDRAFNLVIDKTLGHVCLYEHQFRADSIRKRIAEHKRIVSLSEPPKCTCGTVPEGKSGNIRLDTKASYSPFKHTCFPNLRTFLYSSGPVYLTRVERLPAVAEVDKFGRYLYN